MHDIEFSLFSFIFLSNVYHWHKHSAMAIFVFLLFSFSLLMWYGSRGFGLRWAFHSIHCIQYTMRHDSYLSLSVLLSRAGDFISQTRFNFFLLTLFMFFANHLFSFSLLCVCVPMSVSFAKHTNLSIWLLHFGINIFFFLFVLPMPMPIHLAVYEVHKCSFRRVSCSLAHISSPFRLFWMEMLAWCVWYIIHV